MHNLLQISDCHLVVPDRLLIGVDTQGSLEAVLEQAISEQRPDAVIASGDLAHDPKPHVYARFLETIRAYTAAPLLCLPGNHDVLAAMDCLPQKSLSVGKWGIVPFDSHEDDSTPALVTEADRRAAAAAIMESEAEFLLIATHHPLLAVGAPWIDGHRIQNPEELVQWLSESSYARNENRHSRLKAMVFGHAHQEVAGSCANVPVFGAPSTCFQFKPQSEKFALDDAHPGYRWLTLNDAGEISTEVRRVDSFDINPVLKR